MIKVGIETLNPGMHRTQFVMRGTATLRLLSGEHYFCSNLSFEDESRLQSDDAVMMLFDAGLLVDDDAYVSMGGRNSGPWAGFVIVSNRLSIKHVSIKSTKVDRLLGTIISPKAHRLTLSLTRFKSW